MGVSSVIQVVFSYFSTSITTKNEKKIIKELNAVWDYRVQRRCLKCESFNLNTHPHIWTSLIEGSYTSNQMRPNFWPLQWIFSIKVSRGHPACPHHTPIRQQCRDEWLTPGGGQSSSTCLGVGAVAWRPGSYSTLLMYEVIRPLMDWKWLGLAWSLLMYRQLSYGISGRVSPWCCGLGPDWRSRGHPFKPWPAAPLRILLFQKPVLLALS